MADDDEQPSFLRQRLGDIAPALVDYTDDVVFGDLWKRSDLEPRDRSLITVASLVTGGNTEQLEFHLQYAKDNGVTEGELVGVITHLAFYAGWPKAVSAMTVARRVFRGE